MKKFRCFLLSLALFLFATQSAAADQITYTEPITGSVITLPPQFTDDAQRRDFSGQFGQIACWIMRLDGNNVMQFNVSVDEVVARDIGDVLEKIVFRSSDTNDYEIKSLTSTSLELIRNSSDYERHWAVLLEDGSYFHVSLRIGGNASKERKNEIADQTEIDFGADTNETSLTFMSDFPRVDKAKAPFSGKWLNEKTGVVLNVYGKNLVHFELADDASVCGYYNSFWNSAKLWNGPVAECAMTSEGADTLVIASGKSLDGKYARIAEDNANAPEGLPVPLDGSLRGEWNNDKTLARMLITRGSINLAHDGGSSMTTYEEAPNGLRLHNDKEITKTADGGLLVTGFEGVFYRVGMGRGATSAPGFDVYNGSWHNTTVNMSITIKDGTIVKAQETGFGFSGCKVDADGDLIALDTRGIIVPETGHLIFEDIDGEFVRQGGKAARAGNRSTVQDDSDVIIELLAEDAEIANAPGVILEPDDPPHNLGGWRQTSGAVVTFLFDVEQEGNYLVELFASREQQGEGVVLIRSGEKDTQKTTVKIPQTRGGWGDYRTFSSKTPIFLAAGEGTLSVEATDPKVSDYLINLRAITLRLQK